MKIVINRCFGGFGLSHDAVMHYANLAGFQLYAFVNDRSGQDRINFDGYVPYSPNAKDNHMCIHYSKKPLNKEGKIPDKAYFSPSDIARDDAHLVATVEALKEKANGMCAKLAVVKIPDGTDWQIEEYDGSEHIAEKHRTW